MSERFYRSVTQPMFIGDSRPLDSAYCYGVAVLVELAGRNRSLREAALTHFSLRPIVAAKDST